MMTGGKTDDRLFFLEPQTLTLEPLPAEGWILDVGGGGEGVIGQLMGHSVVSIDKHVSELEEALEASGDAGGTLRIEMDARDLKFLDESFDDAAFFFSLMYMQDEVQRAALREVHRVLKPGGGLWVWDFEFPARGIHRQPIAVYPLVVHLQDRTIETGYGTRWPIRERNEATYATLLRTCGYKIVETAKTGTILYFRCEKM